jgi:hypothetical protein
LRSVKELSELHLVASLRSNPIGIIFVIHILMQIPARTASLLSHKHHRIVNVLSKKYSQFILVSLIIFWFIKITITL